MKDAKVLQNLFKRKNAPAKVKPEPEDLSPLYERKERFGRNIRNMDDLKNSEVDILDNSLREKNGLKLSTPEEMQRKIEMNQRALRASKGKPLIDPVGDTLDYKELRKQASKLGGAAKKGLKSIPIIGTLASLMTAENASAAIPILDQAEGAGMTPEEEDRYIEQIDAVKSQTRSPEELEELRNRIQALAELSKK